MSAETPGTPGGLHLERVSQSQRVVTALFSLALVGMGFVAICGHAERMAQERDRCLDQLHGARPRGR